MGMRTHKIRTRQREETLGETLVYKATWRDYLETTKPRVVLLMLLCALVGMYLATPHAPPISLVVISVIGIAFVASSAAVVNHIADAKVDRQMSRTKDRPLAQGRIHPVAGVMFSAMLGITGMTILLVWVNPLTAWLNLASWVGYGLIYTLYLKHATPQNIVIGGLFGAAPPLYGWTAMTNSLEIGGLILVLIIFLWTPSHFWALALDRREEYERADVPMLPITHGDDYTRRQILYYTIALVVASLAPVAVDMGGVIYLTGALILGGVFVFHAIGLLRNKPNAAIGTFRYSIIYLAALFGLMLFDHII